MASYLPPGYMPPYMPSSLLRGPLPTSPTPRAVGSVAPPPSKGKDYLIAFLVVALLGALIWAFVSSKGSSTTCPPSPPCPPSAAGSPTCAECTALTGCGCPTGCTPTSQCGGSGGSGSGGTCPPPPPPTCAECTALTGCGCPAGCTAAGAADYSSWNLQLLTPNNSADLQYNGSIPLNGIAGGTLPYVTCMTTGAVPFLMVDTSAPANTYFSVWSCPGIGLSMPPTAPPPGHTSLSADMTALTMPAYDVHTAAWGVFSGTTSSPSNYFAATTEAAHSGATPLPMMPNGGYKTYGYLLEVTPANNWIPVPVNFTAL